MRIIIIIFISLFTLQIFIINGQDSLNSDKGFNIATGASINGFVRGGAYANISSDADNNTFLSSAFSDFGLKLGAGNGISYKAFADLRFRYGTEFQEPVNQFNVREGYVKVYGKKWDLSAGQQIIKWGRADFTNPTSRLNPQNYISRSPDREDMDLGNLISAVNWFPSDLISLGAVVAPLYRPSVLLIDPIPLPAYVTLNQNTAITASGGMLSYGLKADIHIRSLDWSFSWFDGYDPMPGIALTGFSIDLTQPVPIPKTDLTTTPYKIRMVGMDFEFAAGDVGVRGESTWTVPVLSSTTHEYVPFPEIRWVAGMDWSKGIWRIAAEYSGKYIIDYYPSAFDPVLGMDSDFSKYAQILQDPNLDLHEFVRQQVAAFNRLYNYQLEKYYHSAAFKIDADLLYGKLSPSILTMYNFTSKDLLVLPEIRFKPADGFTICAGSEIYSGGKGSLYDIVDGFMNSVYVSLRVDF